MSALKSIICNWSRATILFSFLLDDFWVLTNVYAVLIMYKALPHVKERNLYANFFSVFPFSYYGFLWVCPSSSFFSINNTLFALCIVYVYLHEVCTLCFKQCFFLRLCFRKRLFFLKYYWPHMIVISVFDLLMAFLCRPSSWSTRSFGWSCISSCSNKESLSLEKQRSITARERGCESSFNHLLRYVLSLSLFMLSLYVLLIFVFPFRKSVIV